jgi:sporulation protein YlmC with PRC-barrel domain
MMSAGLAAQAVWIIAGLVLASKAGWTAPVPIQRVPSTIRAHQFTALAGTRVENPDGEELGCLKNLVVEIPSGEISYGIIAWRSTFHPGGHLKIAPGSRISTVTAKKNTVFLDMVHNGWHKAPAFKDRDLANLSTPDWQKRITAFYGPAGSSPMTVKRTDHLSPTGPHNETKDRAATRSHQPVLATELIGRVVTNERQERLGKLTDLLVDVGGPKPAFALIRMGSFLKTQGTFAAPLSALTQLAHNKMMLVLKQSDLQQVENFDEQAWERGDNTLYRYETADAK